MGTGLRGAGFLWGADAGAVGDLLDEDAARGNAGGQLCDEWWVLGRYGDCDFFPQAAADGWSCVAIDNTTTADTIKQTASNTTTATLFGTLLNNDIVTFTCVGF